MDDIDQGFPVSLGVTPWSATQPMNTTYLGEYFMNQSSPKYPQVST